MFCRSNNFTNELVRVLNNYHAKQLLTCGNNLRSSSVCYHGKLFNDKSSILPCLPDKIGFNNFYMADIGGTIEMMKAGSNGYSSIFVPDFKRLIND